MVINKEEERLVERITRIRSELEDSITILAHHYQRDSIVHCADMVGDSLELARYAARETTSPYIVFCGVYFMAETADIVTPETRTIILPNIEAGCSLADMATIEQVEACWKMLKNNVHKKIVPITYINSAAEVKAFCGRNGGSVCTSSNAEKVLRWALSNGDKVLFLPDQHLARNTAVRMGIPLEQTVLYYPFCPDGGISPEILNKTKIILWDGNCCVHTVFRPESIDVLRKQYPDISVIVHPECTYDVVKKADYCGSTSYIIKVVSEASKGSRWAIGTEYHLVHRLEQKYPDKFIISLPPQENRCASMYLIDLHHLYQSLNYLRMGKIINCVRVPDEIAKDARMALDRMFAISG